jgi:RHS repeat-associated protein
MRSLPVLLRRLLVSTVVSFPIVGIAQVPREPTTLPRRVRPFDAPGDSTRPTASVSPTSATTMSPQLAVEIGFGDACGFGINYPTITLKGQSIVSQLTITNTGTSGPQCTGVTETATGTITLPVGTDTLWAKVANLNGLRDSAMGVYTYIPAEHRLVINVAAGAINAPPSSTGTLGFSVHNLGTVVDTFTTAALCSGAGLTSTCSTSPNHFPTVPAGDSVTGTATFNTTSTIGALGRLKVVASRSSQSTIADTGYVDITVQARSGPSVVLTGVAPTVTRPRNKCLTISIRPGVAYECGDLRLVHALPSVRTYNKVRTPYLVYHSNISHGLTTIGALVTLDSTKGTPDTVTATVTDSTGTTLGTGRWSTGMSVFAHGATQRVTVVTNTSGLTFGVHWPYTVTVSAKYDSLGVTQQFSATGALVSQTGTVAGANEGEWGGPTGWRIAGWEELTLAGSNGSQAGPRTPWTSTLPLVWIDAEGDTRLYSPLAGDSLVWMAQGVDRPDSIGLVNGQYIRYAQHRAKVVFDNHGNWLETIDRLKDTTFYGSGPVGGSVALKVPSPSGGITYVFYRNTGLTQLDSVIVQGDTNAPQPSGCDMGLVRAARKVCFFFYNLHENDTIVDPNGAKEGFAYGAAAPGNLSAFVMTQYTDKRGTVTRFRYDTAAKLAKVIVDSGASPHLNLTTTFQVAESRGVTAPMPQDSAYTLVTGPRANTGTDSADVSRLWIDQWGEPFRIRDAHGDETELTRANPTYPSLVTYARYANGRVAVAAYDGRGNPQTATDSSFSISGTYPTTRYVFNQTYDFATKIVHPALDSVMMVYDSATGNRTSQQTGSLTAQTVTYTYWKDTATATGRNLLASVIQPVEAPKADSVYYDSLGNDSSTVSPLGIRTHIHRDAMGRVTAIVTPIDSSNSQTDASTYDVMDQVTFTSSHAPALTHNFLADSAKFGPGFRPQDQPFTADSEAVTVTTTYDTAGNPTSIVRQAFPDSGQIGPMRTDIVYDADDRVIHKTQYFGPSEDSSATDYSFLDAAGNDTATITRRGDTIHVTFDALNRRIGRRLAAKEYPRDTSSQFAAWTITAPQYSNCADGTGYCIPADTATYGYDHVGNMTIANNGEAQISRVYLQNGDLLVDSLRIRAFNTTDFTQHVYGLSYTYDLDGRRLTMNHPTNIAPPDSSGGLLDQNTYTYDQQGIGELTDVTDVFGTDFGYQYDLDGRVVHLGVGGIDASVVEHWTYDADSRLIERIDSTLNVSTVNGWQYNTLHDDKYYYDLRGKIIETDLVAPAELAEVFNGYSGLGALVDGLIRPLNYIAFPLSYVEEFTHPDPLGNSLRSYQYSLSPGAGSDSASSAVASTFEPGSGRLLQTVAKGNSQTYRVNVVTNTYDLSGNLVRTIASRPLSVSTGIGLGTDQYYDAEQRLRAVDKHECFLGGSPTCQNSPFSISDVPYMQQYWYDALGRRILTAALTPPTCSSTPNSVTCRGFIERTVYDGDQVLYEIRMPDSVGIGSTDLERDTGGVAGYEGTFKQFGRVVYAHGLGLDDPLDVVRVGFDTLFAVPEVIIPLHDWRGAYDEGALANGARYQCSQSPDSLVFVESLDSLCFFTSSPATDPQYGAYQEDLLIASGIIFPVWNGSLIQSRRDATNQIYLRNRYYDPQTGRFTQEDPVGLAGGLNAYGFASGDPVNYSDPFGLCPDWARGNCTQSEKHSAHPVPTVDQETLQDPGLADPVALATGALAGPLDAVVANAVERLAADGGETVIKEGIYEFTAKSGKTYVGQSNNITRRIGQHVRAGKVTQAAADAAKRTEVLGGKTAREVAEQMRINKLGGIGKLENKVNPIGPARSSLLPPP